MLSEIATDIHCSEQHLLWLFFFFDETTNIPLHPEHCLNSTFVYCSLAIRQVLSACFVLSRDACERGLRSLLLNFAEQEFEQNLALGVSDPQNKQFDI